MMKKLVIGASLLTAGVALAQEDQRLSWQCRREVVQFCGLDRSNFRKCLAGRQKQLSEACKDEIGQRLKNRMEDRERNGTPRLKAEYAALGRIEYAYGRDPLQRLDFFTGGKGGRKPLIIFVHGGGWKWGDKSNATGLDKVRHFRSLGYHFASLNYRLVPGNSVEQQASDVAQGIAWLRSNASQLGIDTRRIVLMGHSAGAHLAALVGTDPQYLRGAGLDLNFLAGVVPIDGAAYDVPRQLVDGNRMMQDTYGQAFGNDPARQRALSPTLQATGPNVSRFLILHVNRPDGVRQSAALAVALREAGTSVQLNGFAGEGMQGHSEINVRLGDPTYPATVVVDRWLAQL